MKIVMVFGPHGSGKTTAAKNALVHGVLPVFGDTDSHWKQPPEIMRQRMVEALAGEERVMLVEGTHRIALAVIRARGQHPLSVHFLRTTPEVMRSCLEARCLAKGKEFKAAYWTHDRCLQDIKYYQNLLTRMGGRQTTYAVMADYSHSKLVSSAVEAELREALL